MISASAQQTTPNGHGPVSSACLRLPDALVSRETPARKIGSSTDRLKWCRSTITLCQLWVCQYSWAQIRFKTSVQSRRLEFQWHYVTNFLINAYDPPSQKSRIFSIRPLQPSANFSHLSVRILSTNHLVPFFLPLGYTANLVSYLDALRTYSFRVGRARPRHCFPDRPAHRADTELFLLFLLVTPATV